MFETRGKSAARSGYDKNEEGTADLTSGNCNRENIVGCFWHLCTLRTTQVENTLLCIGF